MIDQVLKILDDAIADAEGADYYLNRARDKVAALAAAREQQPDTPGLGDDFIDALEAFLRDVDMNIGGLEGWREIFNPRTADTFYSHAENLRAALAAAREQQPVASIRWPNEVMWHEQKRPSGWVTCYAAPPAPSVQQPVEVCPECDIAGCKHIRARNAAPPAQDAEDARVSNLAAMVRRLAWLLKRHDPKCRTADAAMEYLKTNNLEGNVLRHDAARGSEHV